MKQVTVMGIEYEIAQITPETLLKIFEGTDHYEALKKMFGENAQNFSGLCDAQLAKIYINSELPFEKKKKTLIHEIVEALDQECTTDLTHIQMQAIANTLFLTGLVNVEELLKNEPEDIEISIAGNTT